MMGLTEGEIAGVIGHEDSRAGRQGCPHNRPVVGIG